MHNYNKNHPVSSPKPDTSTLENEKVFVGCRRYRCPLCTDEGHDTDGDNLCVYDDGGVTCHRDKAHSTEMWKRLQPAMPVRKTTPVIVAKYNYKDAEGNLVYQAVRYSPKGFKQRQPNGKGGWNWGIKGVERILYRLPELLAADKSEPVFVVEGEKDADRLAELGMVSTTNSAGANKWSNGYTKSLAGRNVVIVADNDSQGWKHASAVAEAISSAAASVGIVDLSANWKECPDKGDVSDWLDAEKPPEPKAQLLEWAAEPEWDTDQQESSDPDATRESSTDAVDAYYDTERKEFLIKNREGIWISLNESQFKRHLRNLGKSTKCEGSLVSPAEKELMELMETRTVRYAAPLAGRQAGYYFEGGVRFLVTESLKLPEPETGPSPTIFAIINGLLGCETHGKRQIETFLGWLRVAVTSLREGKHQPGQALAIAGAADCGKSLLQKIITEVLGGRSAKAALFLSGRSNFNAELFEAEHLMLEDESMAPDIRARRALADAIKGTVVNEMHSCHRKHRTPVNLRPWWRLSISVNDDPEALLVLPPLDDNIKDKITLLRAFKFEMPMPTTTLDERRAFWDKIESEIPQFINYLLESETDKKLLDRRYGVATWHHPDLVFELDGLSPEGHLLGLIDTLIFEDAGVNEWKGTAADLQRGLLEDLSTKGEAHSLLSGWRDACGRYLGRLASKHPERVVKSRTGGSRDWTLIRELP